MTTHTRSIVAVPVLDSLACLLASLLAKATRISGAGVFWMRGGASFWEAWHEPSERGGSWTLRLGLLELVADIDNPPTSGLCEVPDEAAPRATSWERSASLVAWVLDGVAQAVAWTVGRIVASRRGYGAGVFFWRDQPGWWEAWTEPGAFNVRMGRLELNVDMPR